MAEEQAYSHPVSLKTAVFDLLVQAKRKLGGCHIVMGVNQIQAKEPSLKHLLRPDTQFWNCQQMLPLLLLHLVIVPCKESRPRFQAKVSTQAYMLRNRNFQTEVRSSAARIEKICSDGYATVPCSIRLLDNYLFI